MSNAYRHAKNIERSARRRASVDRNPMINMARAMQESKIAKKRTQRRNFAKLDKAKKALHREAGRLHKLPGELVTKGKR
jgi:hypothetical protein